MKHKKVLSIVILLIMCLLLIGCIGGTPKPPVDTAGKAAKLVQQGMSLDEVYALLKTPLRYKTTLYPARNVEKSDTGKWKVSSKEGGFAEDEEVPYQALIFQPDPSRQDYYMVFFEEGTVIGSEWFAYSGANVIIKVLEGTFIPEETE